MINLTIEIEILGMFFEQEKICVEILDVLKLDMKNSRHTCRKREFDVLSFRINADAVIKTDKESIRAGSGDIGFFPGYQPYVRTSKKDLLIAVHFKILSGKSEKIEFFRPKNPQSFGSKFEAMYKSWCEKEAGYMHECLSIFYSLLYSIADEIGNGSDAYCNPKIKDAVRYMRFNYTDQDISIKEIAAKSFVSDSYFRRIFKQDFGISPIKYILNMRIEMAKKLIGLGNMSIKEIAYATGFTDCKYFSTEFKRLVGISPSEYRSGDGK